jgi:hypothetical protein
MPAPNHAGHPMAPAGYGMPEHGQAELDYRQSQAMYPGQVQAAPPQGYGQPQAQMYGEIENMYGYSTMPPQPVSRVLESPSLARLLDANLDNPTRTPRRRQATQSRSPSRRFLSPVSKALDSKAVAARVSQSRTQRDYRNKRKQCLSMEVQLMSSKQTRRSQICCCYWPKIELRTVRSGMSTKERSDGVWCCLS